MRITKNKEDLMKKISDSQFGYREVDLSLLDDNPYQPRLEYDLGQITELAKSIENEGLLQPIEVSPKGDGRYTIVFGHNRVRAYRMLHRTTIPANVLRNSLMDTSLASRSILENLQRNDVSPLETAISFTKLLELGVFSSMGELSKAISVSRAYVSTIVHLLDFSDKVKKDLIARKTIDVTALDIIRKIKDENLREEIYFWYVEEKPSRSVLKKRISDLLGGNKENSISDTSDKPIKYKTKIEDNRTVIDIPAKLDNKKISKIEAFLDTLL